MLKRYEHLFSGENASEAYGLDRAVLAIEKTVAEHEAETNQDRDGAACGGWVEFRRSDGRCVGEHRSRYGQCKK
jgi:hypothetical protein